jgi:protein-tyrosine phosphatase
MTARCSHRGGAVRVGEHEVMAAGLMHVEPADLDGADLVVALVEPHEDRRGLLANHPNVHWASIPDFTAPEPAWLRQQAAVVTAALERGERVLVLCLGGHGRTGTFLAALIALAERDVGDAVAAVRERHCDYAVETSEQQASVRALR